MMNKYTIGFSGFGYMGTRLLRGFLDYRKKGGFVGPLEIVGFRLRESRLRKIRELYPDIIKAESYEDIFKGRDLCDIVIASPTQFHIEQAKFAIERGVDVFLEKPISTDLDEAREFVEFVLDNESIVFVDYIEDSLPISKLRDEVLFGQLSEDYQLIPKSFIAVRTKDRENPDIEKNWRDFDNIAGRDSIHCLYKILKIVSMTSGQEKEQAKLPLSVKAESKDLMHPDPKFSKKVSGQILGELKFKDGVVAKIYTSALAVGRRGFVIPPCSGISESEQEEVKLQYIFCLDKKGEESILILNFIRNTLDVHGIDTGPIDDYVEAHGFRPQKTQVEIEGKRFQRYSFGETQIDMWVMRYYFSLKELKKERPARELNQDVSLSTVAAGYYTQLWAELLQRSADTDGRAIFPKYVKKRGIYALEMR